MSIADKLDEARALIEKGWCQGEYALDRSGRDVGLWDSNAVCFCTTGATWHVDPDGSGAVFDQMLCRALGLSSTADLVAWNDAPERTQAEVIDAFKRAAELARQEHSA